MAKVFQKSMKQKYRPRAKLKANHWKKTPKGSSHSGGRKHKAWWAGNPELQKDGTWVSKKYSTKLG